MAAWRSVAVLILSATSAVAADLTFEAADARLKHAYALAQDADSATLADRVLHLRDGVRRALDRRDLPGAERLIRDAEEAVGLDSGGKSMFGLPVARVSADTRKRTEPLERRLADALKAEDAAAVAAAVADLGRALGNDAGVPDVRRKGDEGKVAAVKAADVADLFLKVLRAELRTWKLLASGNPKPPVLPRTYASFVQGCLIIRPVVRQYHQDRLEFMDELVRGCCRSMLALQTTSGFFKFPDLRERHPRFGALTQKLVDGDPATVKDGWVMAPFPDGGSQFDAGECGVALLAAGATYKSDEWTASGLKAADWVSGQPCVATVHHTASAVTLLCHAAQVTGKRAHLEAALTKYRLGLAMGQTPGGRWLDPFDARTTNHAIVIRALHDLEDRLPPGQDRDAVASAAVKAVKAVTDEAAKLGAPLTSLTVQELDRHLRLHADAGPAVRAVLEVAASTTVERCRAGSRARAAAPLPELAAASRIWRD